jgi:rhodanese-related sulfurtransferase
MKILRLLGVLVSTLTFVLAAEAPKITAAEAAKLVKEGKAVLVDVREPGEWAQGGVAAPAVLLPKSDFDGDQKLWKEFLEKNQGKQVIAYCRGGGRSGAVCEALAKQGVQTANLGGLKDWTAAGLPTRKVEEKK